MGLDSLLAQIGTPIEDPDEETFILFSQNRTASQDLGFVDSRATTLTVPLGDDVEVTVTQSPSLLQSALKTGTTGAVLWRVSPLVASWMKARDNVLFATGVLSSTSAVLELGCGISGVMALALAPRVALYACTDQQYVLKQLRLNIAENAAPMLPRMGKDAQRSSRKRGDGKAKKTPPSSSNPDLCQLPSNIQVFELDWETTSLVALSALLGDSIASLDLVVACDCIYNSHLIDPFVRACVEVCRSRKVGKAVVCLVAQQLRSEDVFQEWLSAFMAEFHTWRVPEELLSPALLPDKGYVVHIGILHSVLDT